MLLLRVTRKFRWINKRTLLSVLQAERDEMDHTLSWEQQV